MVVSAAVAHRIPAGWYRDRDDRTLRRWWDGVAWTDYYSPYTLPIRVVAEPTAAQPETAASLAAVTPAGARHPRTTRSIVRRYLPLAIVAALVIANVVLTLILANGG
jgi:hypothetical protein